MTADAHYGAPPSYCEHCGDLFVSPEETPDAACPNCGAAVRAVVGRFAGIVSVVRFVAGLSQPRRVALIAALMPERHRDDTSESSGELRWLTGWLENHDVATSTFWRRCLIVAIQLTGDDETAMTESRLMATAREVAQRAGASQSFMPRKY